MYSRVCHRSHFHHAHTQTHARMPCSVYTAMFVLPTHIFGYESLFVFVSVRGGFGCFVFVFCWFSPLWSHLLVWPPPRVPYWESFLSHHLHQHHHYHRRPSRIQAKTRREETEGVGGGRREKGTAGWGGVGGEGALAAASSLLETGWMSRWLSRVDQY